MENGGYYIVNDFGQCEQIDVITELKSFIIPCIAGGGPYLGNDFLTMGHTSVEKNLSFIS